MFETLSPDSKKNGMPYVEDHAIHLGRAHNLKANAICPVGTPVKLLNTGILAPIAAVTDPVFGIVVKANKYINTDNLADYPTVLTPFSCIVKAKADSTVTVGDAVAFSGQNTSAGQPKAKTAVSTNFVSGIALQTSADTVDVWIGVLRVPYIKP